MFDRAATPSREELQALVQWLALRVGRSLERAGLLSRDEEASYLELEPNGAAEAFGFSLHAGIGNGESLPLSF